MVLLHPHPRQPDSQFVEAVVEQVADVDGEVEGVGIDWVIFFELVDRAGHFQLVGELVEEVDHDEDAEDGAEQASDVGESLVNLAEGPFYFDILTGLPQVELQVLVALDLVVVHLGQRSHDAPSHCLDVLHWVDRLVRRHRVGSDKEVGVHPVGVREGEVVHVLQIQAPELPLLSVQDRVHEVEVKAECRLFPNVCLQLRLFHTGTGWVKPIVASLDREFVELEQF